MEHVSNKDDVKTSLRKVVKEVRSGYFMESKGSLNCGMWVKLLREKLWVKWLWYLAAILCPAMKYFIGIEVYHKQQISKDRPEMGVTILGERA